jgi:hypothetical protein
MTSSTPRPQVRRQHVRRTFVSVLLGVLCLQAAWVFTVPPFRGLDEHDHAFKAAAVAHGDWSAQHEASEHGWGEFVVVPTSLVEAASPVCESLPYTSVDNCEPGRAHGDGLSEVASSAARYNPAFYAVIGLPARALDGAGALYIMRMMTALVCALLIAGAAATVRSWAKTWTPMVGLLMALTPTMIYTTSMAAPNGVEVAAAALVWSALLGVVKRRGEPRAVARYLSVAAVGAVPLVTVRTLGPLWLLLIVTCVALLLGRDLLTIARTRAAVRAGAVVGVATLAAVAWTLVASTNSLADSDGDFEKSLWFIVPTQAVLWLVQAVAAFPARDELAPQAVYAVVLLAWLAWTVAAMRVGAMRERVTMYAIVAVSFLVPASVTILTYADAGTVWQGRYGYPVSMGFLLVCGLALDRPGRARPPALYAACAVTAVVAVPQLIGQLDVLWRERRASPLADTSLWVEAPTSLIVALTVLGSILLGWTVAHGHASPTPSVDQDVEPSLAAT